MAEQALIADLRIGLTKFDADLRKAMQSAEKASAGITNALAKVDNSVKSLPNEFNKLNQSLQQTEQAANRAAAASEKHTQAIGKLKGVLGSLGLLVTAQQMIQFAISTVKAAEALTSIEQQFVLLTGSQQAAKAEMAFIRAETDRLALSTLEGAKGYARLANAAEGTKLEGEAIRQVFIGLNTMTRALSLSNEEYGRVLNQVTQVIAKGKIQTEELITLAESGIPIFTLLAKSMGVSGDVLADMLQQGKVSSQALILVIDEVQKRYQGLAEQAANTIPSQIQRGWNRLLLEVTDVAQGILKSGELLNAFKFESNILDIFPDREVITANVDYIIRQFTAISKIVEAAFKSTLNSIKTTFRDIVSSLQSFLTPIGDFFKNLPGAAWVGEQFQALVRGLEDADEKVVQAQRDTEQFKGIFFEIFGGEGQTAIQRWDDFVSKAFANFGIEMPSPVNSEKIVKDVQQANKELIKLQEQAHKDLEKLQEEARQKKLHKDIATEEEAMATIASMRRKLDDEAYREQERNRQQLIDSAKDAAKAIQEMRLGLEDDVLKEQEKTHEEFLKILERTNKERIAQDQQVSDEFDKTIENMKENIQEAMGDTISDAIRGDLTNIEDAATAIKDIFADTAANIASEFIAAFAIDPIVDQLKGVIANMKGLTSSESEDGSQTTGSQSTAGHIIGAAGGVVAGVGVAMGVSNAVGGRAGGVLGGMAGGAMAGAAIGSIIPAVGTAIGAAAGAIIGGIVGGFMSETEEKIRLISQTTEGFASSQNTSSFARSPFGIVSMFEDSQVSKEAAASATMAIAEIDSAIAGYLDTQQRAIVEGYFQSAIPEGSEVAAKEVDDAIAKAIQLRLYHALTALEGEDVARNVVGEAFTATAGNIQAIQQRAMQALEILATIADFREGDLSQTAQQIKAINDQFQQLKDRAVVLGLPTDEIMAEQQKQIVEITTNFNEGIGDAILGITDPAKLELVELERMQEERMQNAVDAGADLTAVERLNQLEREELEKRHQQNLTGIADAGQKERESQAARAGILQAIYNITDPFKAAMLSVQQQVLAFQAQVDAGLMPQSFVDEYARAATNQVLEQEEERKRQEAQIVAEFNQNITDSIMAMTDASALEVAEMERLHQERYQKAIEIGADLTAVASLNYMERLELERRHQEELTRLTEQAQKEREAAVTGIFQAIYNITDPFRAAMLSVQQQVEAFQAQVEAGLIPQSLVDRFEEAATQQVIEQEQARREQEAQAIVDFSQSISDAILAMTDSAALEIEQMERLHQERLARAMELGLALTEVERLNQMERQELERQHQEELTRITEQAQQEREAAVAGIFQAIWNITDPFQAAMMSIQQQVAAFQEQVEAGLIPQALVDRYREVATEQAIQQEQDRRMQEAMIIEDFNNQVLASIIGMTDSAAAELFQMEIMHQERIQRAMELGADLAAVEQLNQLEREALEQRHQDELTAIQQSAQAQQEAATANIMQAILNIEDPFAAAMFSMQQQVAAFQAQVDQGLIDQSLVDRYQQAATNQILQQERDRKNREAQAARQAAQQAAAQRQREAEQRRREAQQRAQQRQREAEQRKREAQQRAQQRQREAEQRKREAEQRKREREQEAERRRQNAKQFNSALLGFTNPVAASMIQINEQIAEFRKFASEKIISKAAFNQFKMLALASAEIDQALQAISGGSGTPIEQVGDAFKAFIQAGSPEKSQAVQAMQKLQDQFAGLVESAKILGLSTKDLEKSYLSQAKTIREEAIAAINKEMDAKKEALGQIDEFLASQRLSDVLPDRMRLGESRKQFGQALGSGDVQKSLDAAKVYLDIAQEQFGSTSQFFAARNEVERLLTTMQERQTKNIEAEREKLIRNEERQIEQVQISRSSVDYLRRISGNNSEISKGIGQLIAVARSQTAEQVATRQLLLRLAAKMKA